MGGGQTVHKQDDNILGHLPTPTIVNITDGGQIDANNSWADFTSCCCLSTTEQLPYLMVMQEVSMISTTHL